MSMIPFDSLNMMLGGQFNGQMDPSYFGPARNRSNFTPMDVVEYDKGYELLADVPGMKPEELTVTLDDETRILTVKGDHSEIHEHTQGDVVRSERTRRAFTRTFELPENASLSDISARINNGILNVFVAKLEDKKKAEPRQIQVKTHPGSVDVPTTHVDHKAQGNGAGVAIKSSPKA